MALSLSARLALSVGASAEALPVLERAVEEIEPDSPALAGVLLLDVVVLKLYGGRDDVVGLAERARDLTGACDEVTRVRADTVLGLAHMFSGNAEAAQELLAGSADLIRLGGTPDDVVHLLQHVIVGLAGLERYDDSLTLCRRYLRSVRAVGADWLLPVLLCYLANSAFFTSDFAEQEMAAAEAAGASRMLRQPGFEAYAEVCRGLAAGLRGDTSAAVATLDGCLPRLADSGLRVMSGITLMGLGLLELTEGRWAAAAERYVDLRAFLDEVPAVPGVLHWRADEIEALWRAGRHRIAHERLAEMQAVAGGFGPWDMATLNRVRALLAPTDEAGALFAEAAHWHRQSASPFERARTELCWGEWLLDRGRTAEAHDHLRLARAAFVELETPAWARRAESLADSLVEHRPERPSEAASVAESRPEIRALGPLTVRVSDQPVRVALDQPGQLLRRLIVADGSMHAEQLAAALWPDASEAVAGTRLRNVLARLRRRFGPLVVRHGSVLRIDDRVELDTSRFEELTTRAVRRRGSDEAAAAAQQALDLYRGELLPLERLDTDVIAARERFRQLYLSMLDLLAEHEIAAGRPEAAIEHLRTAIEADRLDEERYVRLAELWVERGNLAPARAVVERAVRVLEEMELPPSAALERVRRRVEATPSRVPASR